MQLGQAHAQGLAYAGEFRLLVPIQDDRPSLPLLPAGLLALQFADAPAQAVDFLALGCSLQGGQDPVRLPVDPLPANPALLRRAGHVAMTAEANDKGTGNPLVGSYHAHGWTSATAASTHTPRHCSCSPLICPPSIVPFVDHLRKCLFLP